MNERDELPALELRYRRALDEGRIVCDCQHPDTAKAMPPHEHAHTCLWRMAHEAADACTELDAAFELTSRQDDIMERTINTLIGEPPPDVLWGYADVPDVAALYRKAYAATVSFITLAGWQGEGEPAKAWHAMHAAAKAITDHIARAYQIIRDAQEAHKGNDDGEA